MPKYIVRKKGLFGTIYVASANYGLYPSTTSREEYAYQFLSEKKAIKVAEKLWGEVVPIDDEKDSSENDEEEETRD